MVESDEFLNGIEELESTQKTLIFILLLWSFLTGNRNLDYLWSYLSVMQLVSHLPLLRNQFPQNAMQMSKTMASVSLMDIKNVQNSIFSNGSMFNVGVHVSSLFGLIEQPKEKIGITDVEAEIS